MYLYITKLYSDTSKLLGTPTNSAADTTDFEDNNKSTAVAVTSLMVSETTFTIEVSYVEFKTLVQNNATWASVKYEPVTNGYFLYLLSNSSLT